MGANFTYYNYKIWHDDEDDVQYFKSQNEIKEKYGISRANMYLMLKDPCNEKRKKYGNIVIEKCRHHFLLIDAGLDIKSFRSGVD